MYSGREHLIVPNNGITIITKADSSNVLPSTISAIGPMSHLKLGTHTMYLQEDVQKNVLAELGGIVTITISPNGRNQEEMKI